MRIIFVLLFICLIQKPASTRTPQPSQKEMQAQMAEAKREAKKQIIELENQIAEAKLKEEDPETIREMEKQLATMKQIFGMMDDAVSAKNKTIKTLPPSKTIEPKYVSPLVPITLKEPFVTPTEAQARDHLLWYKGKKITTNTLVTTTGMIVRYDPQKNIVIVQPDKKTDTFYYGLANTLARTERMKNDFVFKIDGIINSFFFYPEILETYEEFDFAKNRYYALAKNVITLPPLNLTPPASGNNREQLLAQLTVTLNNLPAVTPIAMPPVRPRPICPCGTGVELYEKEVQHWLNDFWKQEELLFNVYMQIYKYLEDTHQSGTLAEVAVLNEAMKQIIVRKTKKLLSLFNYYDNGSIFLEDGLAMATESFYKQLVEIGNHAQDIPRVKSDGYEMCEKITEALFTNKVFNKYIEEQKSKKNHGVALDFDFYMKHELNKQKLDYHYEIPYSSLWKKNMQNYNRFTLNLSLDFELHQVDAEDKPVMIIKGSLESDPVTVSLSQNGCEWSLFLTNPNHRNKSTNENIFYIPFKITEGTKDIIGDDKPPFVYSGPSKMIMVFPDFKISFCNQRRDSVIMNVLRYSDADLKGHIGTHIQSGNQLSFGKEFSIDMIEFVNKMLIVGMEVMDNRAKFEDITRKMLNIPNISTLPQPTTNAILNELFAAYKIHLQKQELEDQMSETAHTGKSRIKLDKYNSQQYPETLYSTKNSIVDPTDKDKRVGLKLITGHVSVDLVHTPL